MVFRWVWWSLSTVAMVLVGSAGAEAGSITFANETFASGSGIGNVPTLLVLQETGSEAGAVSWNGSADVATGHAKSQSRTWSVTDLASLGIVSADPAFALVLNLNETTSYRDVSVVGLQADFFDAAGAVLFTAPYACLACSYGLPFALHEANQGTGSSGFLFRVYLSEAERAAFFASGGNRMGLSASVADTDSGQETFYLAAIASPVTASLDTPLVNPEPPSLILLGTGLVVAAWRGRVYLRSGRQKR